MINIWHLRQTHPTFWGGILAECEFLADLHHFDSVDVATIQVPFTCINEKQASNAYLAFLDAQPTPLHVLRAVSPKRPAAGQDCL